MVHRSFLIAVTLGYLLVPNGVVFCAAPVDFQGDVAIRSWQPTRKSQINPWPP
jgi:hypothetical protein